jgi:hypothetical protein
MHTFGIILVLLSEQHAVLFAHINLLIIHTKTGNNLLCLVQVFWYVVLRWDEINNQLHDIVVALIREVILQFHRNKYVSQLVVQLNQCHRALFHLRWQGAYRNSAPPEVDADLQTLGHTPYQCLLSCHSFGPHRRFRLTHRLWVPAPLHAIATAGSSALIRV